MSKSNFLLVDLNESKTKKLAETITSDTSRKILNHLVEREDSEANIAKDLSIPISTIHYHLQRLLEAGLVVVDEFHYSKKGREVNHYKLANKYIIIAPKRVLGLKEKLEGILPVVLGILGISAVIKVVQQNTNTAKSLVMEAAPLMAADSMEESAGFAGERMAAQLAPVVSQPDIALWFLIGGLSAVLIYLAVQLIKEKLNLKK